MMISSKIVIHRGRGIPSILSVRSPRINPGKQPGRALIRSSNRDSETWEV